jgi:hypothetical protein
MSQSIYIQYHYTYIITNTNTQMKYIGVRSCNFLPENDSDYMGSSKALDEAMNETPETFTKIIIDTFPTREIANSNEQWLHEHYDVARNPMFYNQMNAPLGFCMSGKTGKDNICFGKHHSLETRKKMSISQSGENHSQYGKVPWNKGIPHTDEVKEKLRKANSGSNNHNYGKPRSSEALKNMSGPRGPQKKATCPHCLQIGGRSMMKRHHFSNCKEISTKS